MVSRQPFSSQSTLYILLDYTEDDKANELEIILKALEDTIVVGGAVVGATRLPGVGVGVLGPPFMRLLKLSAVRSNIPLVLSSLRQMVSELTPTQQGTEISMEVSAALDNIVAEADGFTPAQNHPLQLLVVTWRPIHLLTETFSSVLTLSHSKHLRAIHVVGIVSFLDPYTEDDVPAGDAAGGVWVTGATYTADPYTFSALFRSWLSESKGRDPHVHLLFPSSPDEDQPLTLLFDIQELMIDPVSLPSAIASKLTIYKNTYRTVSSTQGSSIPVVELEVIKRVNGSSLSVTLVGPSMYLVPTGATSLSFDRIWENKQYISSLSQKLNEKDEAVLARAIASPGTLSPMVVVLPAPHCSALSLIHVAPAELMLAERNLEGRNSQLGQPEKVTKEIDQKLMELDVSELRLEDHTTNLVESLIHHFNKPARGGTARIPPTNVVHAGNQGATSRGFGVTHTQTSFRGRATNQGSYQQHPAFNTPSSAGARIQNFGPPGRGRIGARALRAFNVGRGRPMSY